MKKSKRLKSNDDKMSSNKIHEYDSGKSAEDYDLSKLDPDTHVKFSTIITSTSKKKINNLHDILFCRCFRLHSPYKESFGNWKCYVEKEILLKESNDTEAEVKKILAENGGECGYTNIIRIAD